MTTRLFFDFDGVFNALSKGIPVVNDGLGDYKTEVLNPFGDRGYQITYRPAVVGWFNSLVESGYDVQWLTTWREHTKMFSALGFEPAPWIAWNDAPMNMGRWGKFDTIQTLGEDIIWVDDHHVWFNDQTDNHCATANIRKITPNDRYGLTQHNISEIEDLLVGG